MGEDDLRVQVALLEGRMNTMQAEYKTDIALLAKEMADGRAAYQTEFSRLAKEMADGRAAYQTEFSRLAEQIADGRTEAAQRETSLVDRMTVRVGIGVAVLGVILAAIRYLP